MCLYRNYIHIGVEGEVVSLEAYSKVALCQFGFRCVEGTLVASQPAIVADHSSTMDCGTSKVKVNITVDIDVFLLVGRLDLATLLAEKVSPSY